MPPTRLHRRRVVIKALLLSLAFLTLYQIRARYRRYYVRKVNTFRKTRGEFHSLVRDIRRYNDSEVFHRIFRMNPNRFDELLQKVKPFLEKERTHACPIGPAERLSFTLNVLASGMSLSRAAISYRIGKSTGCTIFNETCRAIYRALKDDYLSAPTVADLQATSKDFYNLWNFPNCIGAIDGKHVHIKCPNKTGSVFFNYKRSFSMVLMAVCDARYKFTFVDVGGAGRQSDGGTFANSGFGKLIVGHSPNFPAAQNLPGTNIPMPHVFLADEALHLRVNLLRPYPGRDLANDPGRKNRIFNYRLSRARRIIENSFGVLCARWRILLKTIEGKPENVESIVNATLCLHNFLRSGDDALQPTQRYIPPHFVDYEDDQNKVHPGEWRLFVPQGSGRVGRVSTNNYQLGAASIREQFRDYFSDIGSVPWQDACC